MPFGAFIIADFFFAGLSVGLYIISVAALFAGRDGWKPVARMGAVGAAVALVIALVCLILDLEQMHRFWYLFVHMNFSSPITWGSIFLALYGVIVLAYAFLSASGRESPARWLGLMGLPFAVGAHGYAGFVLLVCKGRDMWNSSAYPVMFLLAALLSGLAVIIIMNTIRLKYLTSNVSPEATDLQRRPLDILSYVLIFFLLVYLTILLSQLCMLGNSSEDNYIVYHMLTHWPWAFWYLGVEIAVGTGLPLVILIFSRLRKSFVWLDAACILVITGIIVMRAVVVLAGQRVPLH